MKLNRHVWVVFSLILVDNLLIIGNKKDLRTRGMVRMQGRRSACRMNDNRSDEIKKGYDGHLGWGEPRGLLVSA